MRAASKIILLKYYIHSAIEICIHVIRRFESTYNYDNDVHTPLMHDSCIYITKQKYCIINGETTELHACIEEYVLFLSHPIYFPIKQSWLKLTLCIKKKKPIGLFPNSWKIKQNLQTWSLPITGLSSDRATSKNFIFISYASQKYVKAMVRLIAC